MSTLPAQHQIAYIQSALLKNFTPRQIASGLGISESRVSQIIAANELKVGSASKKAATLDEMYDDLEEQAAKKLKTSLTLASAGLDAVKLTHILSKINQLKRRSHGEGNGVVGKTASLVQLDLPPMLAQNINVVVNPQNEVVAVDGRELTTIRRDSLDKLAAEKGGPVLNHLFGDAPAQSAPTALIHQAIEESQQP